MAGGRTQNLKMEDDQGRDVSDCLPSELPPFLKKTYQLVADTSNNDIISWGKDGHSFVVWDSGAFSSDELPKHFKHNNFSSFVRQLNTYGFTKSSTDQWEFRHPHFHRGAYQELTRITRRKGDPRTSSSASTMQVPTYRAPAGYIRPSTYTGELSGAAAEATTLRGPTDKLGRLGAMAGTMLQEAYTQGRACANAANSRFASISSGEAQQSSARLHAGDCGSGVGEEAKGELRRELGQQRQVISELATEVGKLREQQGAMAAQLMQMEGHQQACKRQRTCTPPPPGWVNQRVDSRAHPAERLCAWESRLARVEETAFATHMGMKGLEAYVKGEAESVASRMCTALYHLAVPGSQLEPALTQALKASNTPLPGQDKDPAEQRQAPPQYFAEGGRCYKATCETERDSSSAMRERSVGGSVPPAS